MDEPSRRLGLFRRVKDDGLHVMSCGNVLNNNTIRLFEYVIDAGTKTTYLKGKFLGKGGFARVHEMTDLTTNKVYAGKIIPKSRLTKPQQKEKILKEINLHRTLKHKNIVQFHHYFEDQDNVYIIMEYCARKSLVHVLKNRKTLTEPEVRYYMHQLAEGVEYIHEEKVIHRDLKLGNMFLSENMNVKIGDFGLATRLEEGGTQKTTVCGTPNYIAPEVLNVEGHGFAADIWAMGCILYAMLVGQPPFETSTINETYARISNNRYSVPNSVTEPARGLITSLLQKNPEDRPTISQVLQHEFFTSGWIPKVLSPYYCITQPRRLAETPTSTRSTPTMRETIEDAEKLECSLPALHLHLPQEVDIKKDPEVVKTKEKKKSHRSLRSSLKQKLANMFSRHKSSKKKNCSPACLYHMLESCLRDMPKESAENPPTLPRHTLLFITKWIDYSNKYGFGYQLSDRSVGVVFNDGTRLSLAPDHKHVDLWPPLGKPITFTTSNIPPDLRMRFTLLQYFAQYMDENLTEGGALQHRKSGKWKGAVPHLKRWIRTNNAIVMQLSNGTVQINFFADHTKLVISGTCHGLLMYIDQDRQPATFSLKSIAKKGCHASICNHMKYTLSILQEFADMEDM